MNRFSIDCNLNAMFDFTRCKGLELTLSFTVVPKIRLNYVENIQIISTQIVTKHHISTFLAKSEIFVSL